MAPPPRALSDRKGRVVGRQAGCLEPEIEGPGAVGTMERRHRVVESGSLHT